MHRKVFWEHPFFFYYFPETPENKAFADEFHKAYGRYPKVGALYGYISAGFIVKAYEKAGKVDSAACISSTMPYFMVSAPIPRR